jgi:hypothetical protein
MPDNDADEAVPADLEFECPRCHQTVTERFWGPCADCRTALKESMVADALETEIARFEPTMHVVPNQVATKD